MKKYTLLFLILAANITAFGQMSFYLTGNFGSTVNLWNPAPFNEFVDSYNGYVTNNVKSKFDKYSGTMVGFSRGFGGIVDINKASFGFDYTKTAYNQSRTMAFNNGNGREVKLRFVTWNFNFDISRKLGKRVDFGLLFGVSMRSGTVFSYATYGNPENRSAGAEFWINGIYKGIVQNDFNLGLNLRVNFLKYFAIQVRGYRAFAWAKPKKGEEYLEAFSDGSPGKNLFSEYFPKDMQKFEENVQNQNYDYQNNVIPNIFPGWYIQTSLLIKLKLNKDK